MGMGERTGAHVNQGGLAGLLPHTDYGKACLISSLQLLVGKVEGELGVLGKWR